MIVRWSAGSLGDWVTGCHYPDLPDHPHDWQGKGIAEFFTAMRPAILDPNSNMGGMQKNGVPVGYRRYIIYDWSALTVFTFQGAVIQLV